MKGLRILLVAVLAAVTVAGLLAAFFHLAGGWDWFEGWAFVGLLLFAHGLSSLWIWRRQPEVLKRRGAIGKGTKGWDVVWLGGFGILVVGMLLVAAAENGRTGPAFAEGWRLVGMVLYAHFVVVLTWCMVENPFFEKTVRIQEDRGHRVITTGPYRIVRHPGYAALIVGFLFGPPLLLRSGHAFVLAAVAALWVVARAGLEDRVLRRELEGYEDYARHVRYRLVPGIW